MNKNPAIQNLIGIINEVTLGHGDNCTNYGRAILNKIKECKNDDLVCDLRLVWRITSFHLTDDPQEPLEPVDLLNTLDRAKIQLLAHHREELESIDLQARVLDLAQILVTSEPKRIQLVSMAWEAYFEAATVLFPTDSWFPYFKRVQRGAQLSLSRGFKRAETLEKIYTAIELGKDVNSFLLLNLAKTALEFPKVDKPKIFTYLKVAAQRAWKKNDWEMARQYLKIAVKCVQASDRRPLLLKIAKSYENEADSRPSSLVACSFVEDAIQAYRKAGDSAAQVKRLHRKLLELGKKGLREMQSYEEKIDIAPIIQVVEQELVGKDFRETMITFARIILQQGPRKQETIKHVQELSQKFVFQNLMPPKVYDSSGRVIRRGGQEDQETRLIQDAYSQTRQHFLLLAHGVIEAGRVTICRQHRLLRSDVEGFFSQSPFIAPQQEGLFCTGLYEGFKGRYDVAAHLLVPQLEAGIRNLLETDQVFVSRLDKNLFQDRYLLGSLLANEKLEEIMGEDLVFTLKSLLNEKAGENYRNLLCHGLLSDQQAWSTASVCVWGYSLALTMWPFLKKIEDLQSAKTCLAITRQGERCRRKPMAGLRYCHTHSANAAEAPGHPNTR